MARESPPLGAGMRLPQPPPRAAPPPAAWRSCRSGIDPAPPKQSKGAERYVGDFSPGRGGEAGNGAGEAKRLAFDVGG